jgi:hypothetical protein
MHAHMHTLLYTPTRTQKYTHSECVNTRPLGRAMHIHLLCLRLAGLGLSLGLLMWRRRAASSGTCSTSWEVGALGLALGWAAFPATTLRTTASHGRAALCHKSLPAPALQRLPARCTGCSGTPRL